MPSKENRTLKNCFVSQDQFVQSYTVVQFNTVQVHIAVENSVV